MQKSIDNDVWERASELIGNNGHKARFDRRVTRLMIERLTNGRVTQVVLVDQNGVMKMNGREFLILPLDFLRLDVLFRSVYEE